MKKTKEKNKEPSNKLKMIPGSVSSTISSMLTREQEAEIFKGLINKTSLEIGKDYGLDKHFNSDGAIRIAVYNIYNRVKKIPDVYGISPEVVEIVSDVVSSRKAMVNNPKSALAVEREKEEFKDKLESIRDTAAEILNKKLEKINKSNKNLDDVKLKEIADVMSMAVDKYRLVKGESTDNVIHYSKLNLDNVSPDEALSLVLKAREAYIESKK